MSILAKRLAAVKPSPTVAVTTKAAELKAQGLDVIHPHRVRVRLEELAIAPLAFAQCALASPILRDVARSSRGVDDTAVCIAQNAAASTGSPKPLRPLPITTLGVPQAGGGTVILSSTMPASVVTSLFWPRPSACWATNRD